MKRYLVSGEGLPPELPLCSRGRGSHHHHSSSGISIKMKDSISVSTMFSISVSTMFSISVSTMFSISVSTMFSISVAQCLVFLSVQCLVFLSVHVAPYSIYNWHLNKAGSCPENWEEMKITQDSGEVTNPIPKIICHHNPF